MQKNINFTLLQFLGVFVIIAIFLFFTYPFVALFAILAFFIAKDQKLEYFRGYFIYALSFIGLLFFLLLADTSKHGGPSNGLPPQIYASLSGVSFSLLFQLIFLLIKQQKKNWLRLFICTAFSLFCFVLFVPFVSASLSFQNRILSYENSGPKTMIKKLDIAIKLYKADWGIYPPFAPKTYDTSQLIIYLDGDKSNGGPKSTYFEFKQDDLDMTIKPYGALMDRWERPIHYKPPKKPDGTLIFPAPYKEGGKGFDLWSEGRKSVSDGDIQGVDDIRNFGVVKPKKAEEVFPIYILLSLFLIFFNILWFYFLSRFFFETGNSESSKKKANLTLTEKLP